MLYKQRTATPGFTLIELMISIGIIAVLLGGVYAFYSRVQTNAKTQTTKTALMEIRVALDEYNAENDAYPAKLSDMNKKLPKDGWGNEFRYRPTPNGAYPYELYSYGPGGQGSPKEEHISVSRK